MKLFWRLWDFQAVSGVMGIAAVVTFYMVKAYLNGATKILLDFNEIGEAQAEIILFPIWSAMALVTIIRMVRNFVRSIRH